MTDLLEYLALVFELVLLVYVLLAHVRERGALKSFVLRANEVEHLKDWAKLLPFPYRAAATQFAGDLQRKNPLDDVLSQAMTKTANTIFGPPPATRLGMAVVITLVVFAPLMLALFEAASSVVHLRSVVAFLHEPGLFPLAKETLEPSFRDLGSAFRSSAALSAGAVFIGCAHWWLNRDEVREARFVQAMLEAAIIARPGAAAPVSGRLTELIAPDRRLRMPVVAFLSFCLAAGAGWCVLYLTAGVKADNSVDVYHVWPKLEHLEPVSPAPGMKVPEFTGGGSPIYPTPKPPPTLTIGPEKVAIGTTTDFGVLEHDHLPPDWKTKIVGLKNLDSFKDKNQLEITIAADRDVSMSAVLDLLDYLRTNCALTRSRLIFRRQLPGGGPKGTPSQAVISLDLKPHNGSVPDVMRIEIDPSAVTIETGLGPPKVVKSSDHRWRKKLWDAVQTGMGKAGGAELIQWVAVAVKDRELTYEKFMEILTTTDDTCSDDFDCGVPGRGLRFFLAEGASQ
jgi:hypothetical protein